MLVFNIQPDEGISLKFESKIPGQENRIRPVNMDFRYTEPVWRGSAGSV